MGTRYYIEGTNLKKSYRMALISHRKLYLIIQQYYYLYNNIPQAYNKCTVADYARFFFLLPQYNILFPQEDILLPQPQVLVDRTLSHFS